MGYSENMFEIELPIKIISESNVCEHWAVKGKRHSLQKKAIRLVLLNRNLKPPCIVTITRIAPRNLDEHDNLRSSFKWVVDAIAASLTADLVPGRADGHTMIKWAYSQERRKPREYAIRIRIEEVSNVENTEDA